MMRDDSNVRSMPHQKTYRLAIPLVRLARLDIALRAITPISSPYSGYSYAALRFSLARRRLPFHSVLILYRALIMATQRAIASVGPLP